MSVGYGVEVWCTDARVTGRFARGPMLVAQAVFRRYITPRGRLRGGDEESIYGFDVSGYIGAVGYPTAIAALPQLMANEAEKDDRVLPGGVDVQITQAEDSAGLISLTIAVAATLADESGDFTLTLSASAAATVLIGITT